MPCGRRWLRWRARRTSWRRIDRHVVPPVRMQTVSCDACIAFAANFRSIEQLRCKGREPTGSIEPAASMLWPRAGTFSRKAKAAAAAARGRVQREQARRCTAGARRVATVERGQGCLAAWWRFAAQRCHCRIGRAVRSSDTNTGAMHTLSIVFGPVLAMCKCHERTTRATRAALGAHTCECRLKTWRSRIVWTRCLMDWLAARCH